MIWIFAVFNSVLPPTPIHRRRVCGMRGAGGRAATYEGCLSAAAFSMGVGAEVLWFCGFERLGYGAWSGEGLIDGKGGECL